MKRRAISFITILAICLSLCPTWVLAADGLPDFTPSQVVELNVDKTNDQVFTISIPLRFDMQGHSYTASSTDAIRVESTGKLHLTGGGTITSKNGAGVEVQEGGELYISDPDLIIVGSSYALDVASGAAVELSGGTYTGRKYAIQTADGDFGALLKPGYGYFDAESNNPIPLTDVAAAKTVVVKACTDHVYQYTHNAGTPTHTWACAICGAGAESEPCTFHFDENGQAECDFCGDRISISVDESSLGDLIYGRGQLIF